MEQFTLLSEYLAFQILFRNAVLILSQVVSIHAWSNSIMGIRIHSTSRLNFNAVQIVEDALGIFIPPRDHTVVRMSIFYSDTLRRWVSYVLNVSLFYAFIPTISNISFS